MPGTAEVVRETAKELFGVSSGNISAVKYSKEDVSKELVGESKEKIYDELFVWPNTKENKKGYYQLTGQRD